MANTSRINGFRPVKYLSGAPWSGKGRMYAVSASDSTALFVGDLVKQDTNTHVSGMQCVTRATAGAQILGVIIGIVPAKMDPVTGALSTGSTTLDTPQYRAASTVALVEVCDDPNVIFETEAVTSGGAAYSFALADIGLNADGYIATGSTTTGVSAMGLNMTGAATTATLHFRILGTSQRVDNEATGNATKVLVLPNAHQLKSVGTVGV